MCYISCICLKRYKRKMCTTIVLSVLYSLQVGGLYHKNQNPNGDLDFLNFVYKSSGFSIGNFLVAFSGFQKFRVDGFLF